MYKTHKQLKKFSNNFISDRIINQFDVEIIITMTENQNMLDIIRDMIALES